MKRTVPFLAAASMIAAIHAHAQEPSAKQQSVQEVQALVDKINKQLADMDAATKQRDQGLQFLQDQIDKATGRLEGTDATNEALRAKVGELGTTVDDLAAQQKTLDQNLQATTQEKETLEQQLARKISELEASLAAERKNGAAALSEKQQQIDQANTKVASLRGELAAEQSRLQGALSQEQTATSEATATLESTRDELTSARLRINQLEGLLDSTRTSLVAMESVLGDTRVRVSDQQSTIDDLGKRLNDALASKVAELSRYRSEFFGTLRQALGDRPDIRVVGDRFVLQSELLFDPGSAEIGPAGQAELDKIAQTLQQIAPSIPQNVPWVLRVDGHTDRQPIRNGRFASNWELSTARAVSVVQYLISRGLPPTRLAAAGFGEYKPLDPRDDEIAYRRNRRIEFKLTES